METKIYKTNTENGTAIQEKLSLPTTEVQITPKRIRKRIKYNKPASEIQIKGLIGPDGNLIKANTF
jgi:hypothetical protein